VPLEEISLSFDVLPEQQNKVFETFGFVIHIIKFENTIF